MSFASILEDMFCTFLLVDILLHCILSYLSFYERFFLRKSCWHFILIANRLALPRLIFPDLLYIQVVAAHCSLLLKIERSVGGLLFFAQELEQSVRVLDGCGAWQESNRLS